MCFSFFLSIIFMRNKYSSEKLSSTRVVFRMTFCFPCLSCSTFVWKVFTIFCTFADKQSHKKVFFISSHSSSLDAKCWNTICFQNILFLAHRKNKNQSWWFICVLGIQKHTAAQWALMIYIRIRVEENGGKKKCFISRPW